MRFRVLEISPIINLSSGIMDKTAVMEEERRGFYNVVVDNESVISSLLENWYISSFRIMGVHHLTNGCVKPMYQCHIMELEHVKEFEGVIKVRPLNDVFWNFDDHIRSTS